MLFLGPMKKLLTGLLVLLCDACFTQIAPSIQFTTVPDWGSSHLLQGMVHHTTLSDHGVAVYIFLEEAGGWWNKPFASNPVTSIRQDSGFTTNIATAATDPFATKIIAFLVPLSFSPPVISGENLPDNLFSFPYVASCRPHGNRIISWSGFDWIVKKSIGSSLLPIGPGPNIFNDNDSMVWVDNQQRLHLRIAKAGNDWHCSELICKSSLGYNRYQFDIGSRIDLLDRNIIAGIFTWDDCSPLARPPNMYFREIDFEFSRWGIANNQNSQYVIQPYTVTGNVNRFDMNLTGIDHSVHCFDWTSDSIIFKSTWGDSSYTWKYLNSTYIPVPANENIRINFHLFSGTPPSDNQPAELILNSFMTTIDKHGDKNTHVSIFPNPVEQGCQIEILSERPKDIEIGIIDLQGKFLRKVFAGKLKVGSNRFEWNGRTENEKRIKPGLYLIYIREKSETNYYKIVKL